MMAGISANSVRWCATIGVFACCNVSAQALIGASPGVEARYAQAERVPFVTVREIEEDRKSMRYYGQGRGEASAGECTVDLDARERRQVVAVRQRPRAELLDGMYASGGRVVVYVHGYNVSFDQSCREAALLQSKLALEGRLLLFSWPAQGNVTAYLRDVGDIEWSTLPLRNLLLELARRIGSGNIDIIGHSLGAKGVIDAVRRLSGQTDGPLGHVILVAPDVDGDVFVRDYATLEAMASAVTLYVSAQDRALKASRTVRSEPRLGEAGTDLSMLEGIDVVDVRQRRWLRGHGHLYHLELDSVAEDLRETLSLSPQSRGWRSIGTGSP